MAAKTIIIGMCLAVASHGYRISERQLRATPEVPSGLQPSTVIPANGAFNTESLTSNFSPNQFFGGGSPAETTASASKRQIAGIPDPTGLTGVVAGAGTGVPDPTDVAGSIAGAGAGVPDPTDVAGSVAGAGAGVPDPTDVAGSVAGAGAGAGIPDPTGLTGAVAGAGAGTPDPTDVAGSVGGAGAAVPDPTDMFTNFLNFLSGSGVDPTAILGAGKKRQLPTTPDVPSGLQPSTMIPEFGAFTPDNLANNFISGQYLGGGSPAETAASALNRQLSPLDE